MPRLSDTDAVRRRRSEFSKPLTASDQSWRCIAETPASK
jgi:hypothetical protein